MPALQLGYINHNSNLISSGLVIQTSLEYRAKSNFLFRINYDDFSGRINVNDANNNHYIAKVPLSELISGIGYRLKANRHNYFVIIQSGIRFYELPTIENLNGTIEINQTGELIAPMRYTIGYEYEFMEKVFFNVEGFMGHFVKTKDYWTNDKPFYGFTMGISTTIR